MAKALASMNVRKMDLDRRSAAAGDGVAQRDRGVGIGSGVDDDAGSLGSRLLNPVDQMTFMVRLAEVIAAPRASPLSRTSFSMSCSVVLP